MMRQLFVKRTIVRSLLIVFAGQANTMATDMKVKIYNSSKKLQIQLLAFCCLLTCLAVPVAHAVPLLIDWIFNIDGCNANGGFF